MRCIEALAACGALLLAGCAAPAGESASAAGVPARVAGAVPATVHGGAARSWEEYRLRAARRIHDANPGETFAGALPDPLQSIPVLQVQLDRDGSVRRIDVLRVPQQSPQTVEMAIRAIRRAAPFDPVGHLPRPWQFNETFLYNADLKFQLRTLVEAP